MDISKLSKNIKFSQYDFSNNFLNYNSVLDKFEQVAFEHAEIIGVGFEQMLKQNLLWVALRIKYKIISLPKPEENLILTTFPSKKTMFEFDRDFVIENDSNIIIKGTSKWCLIDKNTRKLAKIDRISPLDNLSNTSVFDEKFLKTEIFDTQNLSPEFEYVVNKNDIDKNGHMNNKVYAKILQQANKNFGEYNFFQINFIKETLLGQKILIYSKKIDKKVIFVGKLESGETSFSAEICQEQ